MGLAIKGNNIGIYKACIKDANSLKDLTLPPLFSESNRLNLGPVPSFLFILTAVRQEKIYQHFCSIWQHLAAFGSIWQHLAAKCAIRAPRRVAYGLEQKAANCRI